MPDIKEKLVELIHHCTSCEECFDTDIADHLIANGVTIQEWIPVEERLPEIYHTVLTARTDGEWYDIAAECIGQDGRWSMDCRTTDVITHWMPLPEPPKGEQ